MERLHPGSLLSQKARAPLKCGALACRPSRWLECVAAVGGFGGVSASPRSQGLAAIAVDVRDLAVRVPRVIELGGAVAREVGVRSRRARVVKGPAVEERGRHVVGVGSGTNLVG